LSKLWSGWRNPLIIVKPDTVVAWSSKSFRLFWTWRSRRGQTGRPAVTKDVRDLIRKISQGNPLYVKFQYMWSIPTKACQLGSLGFSLHIIFGRSLEKRLIWLVN